MNILRNMEAIFIVAVAALTCLSAFAAPTMVHAPAHQATGNSKMIKVVITGKRLSPLQKARLGI